MYTSPPRIFCCEIRTFIIVLSVLAIFGNTVTMFERGTKMKFASGASLILEFITLYGAVKNNSRALKVALIVSAVNAIFVVLSLLVVPVLLSAQVGSGYHSRDVNNSLLEDTTDETDTKEFRFMAGISIGYLTEFIFIVTLSLTIAKYVLIDRIYMYAKSLECGDLKGPQVA